MNFKTLLLELFFPSHCFSCGLKRNSQTNPTGFFCFNCQNKIKLNQWLFCLECRRRIPRESQSCPVHSSPVSGLGVMGSYSDPILKQAIWKYKYEFIEELSSSLGALLFHYFKTVVSPQLKPQPQDWLISFIPLTAKRKRWRGFNQAELLAKEISQRSGLKLEKTLQRVKFKKPQMELKTKAERQANVENCFALIKPEVIKNKNLLLVDDIATSGATLKEAGRLLKQAGAKRIWGLVLARDN